MFYILCEVINKHQFVANFVICIVLLAADFWTVRGGLLSLCYSSHVHTHVSCCVTCIVLLAADFGTVRGGQLVVSSFTLPPKHTPTHTNTHTHICIHRMNRSKT